MTLISDHLAHFLCRMDHASMFFREARISGERSGMTGIFPDFFAKGNAFGLYLPDPFLLIVP